jgi:hypothetical protein
MTTSEARRIAQLALQLDEERIARRQAEQRLAGMCSAVVRLQALVAKQRGRSCRSEGRGARRIEGSK